MGCPDGAEGKVLEHLVDHGVSMANPIDAKISTVHALAAQINKQVIRIFLLYVQSEPVIAPPVSECELTWADLH